MFVRRISLLLLFAGVLAVYLLNGRFVESTDTFGNELLPISIVQRGALDFDQYYLQPDANGAYPTGDAAVAPGSVPKEFAYRVTPDVPERSVPWWFHRNADGHVVSTYPIAPGLLNTPVFAVASLIGVDLPNNVIELTHITSSVIAALSVLAMYLCLSQLTRHRTAVFLTVAFAFGTEVWSLNSRSLFQHGASVLFITTALAALLAPRMSDKQLAEAHAHAH